MVGVGRHHGDLLARGEPAIDHADIGDNATVGVIDGVKNHGAGRRIRVELGGRRRHQLADLVQQLDHTQVQVGEGLGFDALGGVDKQDGAFTRLEGAGDFVGKVHVARSVDHL